MDNLQTGTENGTAEHAEFWKGIVLGTMVGMIIAAFTYEIVDRDMKKLKEPGQAHAQIDQRAA
jgi:hypothetical protein